MKSLGAFLQLAARPAVIIFSLFVLLIQWIVARLLGGLANFPESDAVILKVVTVAFHADGGRHLVVVLALALAGYCPGAAALPVVILVAVFSRGVGVYAGALARIFLMVAIVVGVCFVTLALPPASAVEIAVVAALIVLGQASFRRRTLRHYATADLV